MLGAGDAFLSGFLRGWLEGRAALKTCATSDECLRRIRGLPPAMLAGTADWAELGFFLKNGSKHRALPARTRRSTTSTGASNRKDDIPLTVALAIDHVRS